MKQSEAATSSSHHVSSFTRFASAVTFPSASSKPSSSKSSSGNTPSHSLPLPLSSLPQAHSPYTIYRDRLDSITISTISAVSTSKTVKGKANVDKYPHVFADRRFLICDGMFHEHLLLPLTLTIENRGGTLKTVKTLTRLKKSGDLIDVVVVPSLCEARDNTDRHRLIQRVHPFIVDHPTMFLRSSDWIYRSAFEGSQLETDLVLDHYLEEVAFRDSKVAEMLDTRPTKRKRSSDKATHVAEKHGEMYRQILDFMTKYDWSGKSRKTFLADCQKQYTGPRPVSVAYCLRHYSVFFEAANGSFAQTGRPAARKSKLKEHVPFTEDDFDDSSSQDGDDGDVKIGASYTVQEFESHGETSQRSQPIVDASNLDRVTRDSRSLTPESADCSISAVSLALRSSVRDDETAPVEPMSVCETRMPRTVEHQIRNAKSTHHSTGAAGEIPARHLSPSMIEEAVTGTSYLQNRNHFAPRVLDDWVESRILQIAPAASTDFLSASRSISSRESMDAGIRIVQLKSSFFRAMDGTIDESLSWKNAEEQIKVVLERQCSTLHDVNTSDLVLSIVTLENCQSWMLAVVFVSSKYQLLLDPCPSTPLTGESRLADLFDYAFGYFWRSRSTDGKGVYRHEDWEHVYVSGSSGFPASFAPPLIAHVIDRVLELFESSRSQLSNGHSADETSTSDVSLIRNIVAMVETLTYDTAEVIAKKMAPGTV